MKLRKLLFTLSIVLLFSCEKDPEIGNKTNKTERIETWKELENSSISYANHGILENGHLIIYNTERASIYDTTDFSLIHSFEYGFNAFHYYLRPCIRGNFLVMTRPISPGSRNQILSIFDLYDPLKPQNQLLDLNAFEQYDSGFRRNMVLSENPKDNNSNYGLFLRSKDATSPIVYFNLRLRNGNSSELSPEININFNGISSSNLIHLERAIYTSNSIILSSFNSSTTSDEIIINRSDTSAILYKNSFRYALINSKIYSYSNPEGLFRAIDRNNKTKIETPKQFHWVLNILEQQTGTDLFYNGIYNDELYWLDAKQDEIKYLKSPKIDRSIVCKFNSYLLGQSVRTASTHYVSSISNNQ